MPGLSQIPIIQVWNKKADSTVRIAITSKTTKQNVCVWLKIKNNNNLMNFTKGEWFEHVFKLNFKLVNNYEQKSP